MELIDIYIQEVTRRLPEKGQKDIALELRSTIEDMLPEGYSEKDVYKVLAKLGSPAKLASGYLDRPMHLIGPRYYDVYITLLKMIIPIAVTVSLIVLIADNIWSYNQEEALITIILTIIGEGIWGIITVSIQTFFWITLMFAILERTDKSKEKSPLTINFKDWTPQELKQTPYILKDKIISHANLFGNLLGIAIFVAIYFNAVHLIGVYENFDGRLQLVIPTFNQEVLHSYWFIVVFAIAVEVALVLYKFIVGQWTTKVALMNGVRNIISSFMFIIIIINPSVLNPDFIVYLEKLFNVSIEISSIVIGGILLFIVFALIDIFQGFRKANISK